MPRFSITSDPCWSSMRRNNFPKLARARRADTTIAPLLRALEGVAMNSPFQLSELYSSLQAKSRERQVEHRLAFIDDLDVVAVWIEHPGGIIAGIVFGTGL